MAKKKGSGTYKGRGYSTVVEPESGGTGKFIARIDQDGGGPGNYIREPAAPGATMGNLVRFDHEDDALDAGEKNIGLGIF